jgi:hypothetical protein
MGRKLRTAVQYSYAMHKWAMGLLRKHWLENMTVLTVNELQPMMTYWMREQGMEPLVQRYGMDTALVRTVNHFNNGLKPLSVQAQGGQEEAVIRMPTEATAEEWDRIDIQSRQVWRRYLEDYGRLTTSYGVLFLEGDWTQEMRGYAEDLEVKLEILPHLWNSVTLREGAEKEDSVDEDQELWLMRFNFFKPHSHAAKKHIKKGRMYVEDN